MSAVAVEDPILAEIVRRLVETYRPERVYLFGSHARGDAGPDSDYDLMVVVPNQTPPHAAPPAGHIKRCGAYGPRPTC